MLNRQTGSANDVDFVKNSIHPIHRQQIVTLFAKIAHGSTGGKSSLPTDRLSIMGVRDLGYMLGQHLTEEEWTIVAQEGLEDTDTSQMIIIDKIVSVIEKMADDTRIDPYNLIKSLLEDANRIEEFINMETQKVDFVAFKQTTLLLQKLPQ